MNKVLITGAGGFVGRHLVESLQKAGIETVSVLRSDLKIGSEYQTMSLDLSISSEAEKIDFKEIGSVIHLAGLAAVGESFTSPTRYINTNVGIEANLYEAAIKQNVRPKFLIISSGSLYSPNQDMPLNESSKILPNSPYAVSKLGQENLAQYYTTRGFESIIVRPFNHIGPGQSIGFIVPDLVRQVLDYKENKINHINVGNLNSKRDYTDVRDIVEAYILLLENGNSGEVYNVCSGSSLSGQDILNIVQSELKCEPKINIDESKIRPSDPDLICGDYSKLKTGTGWQPKIEVKDSIKDFIETIKI